MGKGVMGEDAPTQGSKAAAAAKGKNAAAPAKKKYARAGLLSAAWSVKG